MPKKIFYFIDHIHFECSRTGIMGFLKAYISFTKEKESQIVDIVKNLHISNRKWLFSKMKNVRTFDDGLNITF